MDTFLNASFGTYMSALFGGIFSAPSWTTFTYLASGWSLAWGRQTIPTYLCISGAARVKPFSRYYAFLGKTLYPARYRLWARVIRVGAALIAKDHIIVLAIDDHTAKKAGRHIAGRHRYRNGAGSARQEYRVLEGINLVLAIMSIPLTRWPGHSLSFPLGLELYLKEPLANQLGVAYRSRSQLARTIVDLAAEQLPSRSLHVLGAGDFAPRDFLRQLPHNVEVTSRFLVTAKLYEPPPQVTPRRRGPRRKTGALVGSAKTLAQSSQGWQPPPDEPGAVVQSWLGLWHSVLPGRLIRVVVVRRPHLEDAAKGSGKKPCGRTKSLDAFFSTDCDVTPESILRAYEGRWAIEIAIRDARGFDGLAQDQCRKRTHVLAANTCRLLLAAARTLWFMKQSEPHGAFDLTRLRPWYQQKVAPSQLDVVWACREALTEAGIVPIPRFCTAPGNFQPLPDQPLPRTA